jgi:glucokinase
MTPWLLALDFGGTKLTAGLLAAGNLHEAPSWHAHRLVISPPCTDYRYEIEMMKVMAREVLAGAQPSAIGVSFGGPVESESGVVRLSHHVRGWENIPLAAILSSEFAAPTKVDNDANVAALGEHRFGAGQGCKSMLYITVSTGVGGGWILDGEIWHGAQGIAGEIGHTVVDRNGPLCLCGKRGCVERLASGPYMAADARAILQDDPQQGEVLRQIAEGNFHAISGQTLSQAAQAGDEFSWKLLQRGAWALGLAIGNAANLMNPERFILGGGVTKAGDRYWEVIRTVAGETALPQIQFEILPAALGDDAPLWGAAALAADCLNS